MLDKTVRRNWSTEYGTLNATVQQYKNNAASYYGQLCEATERITDLEQERDELVAQVEGMRHTFGDILNYLHKQGMIEIWCEQALSTTPSEALREVEARVLEEAAEYLEDEGYPHQSNEVLRAMAATKRQTP